MKSRRIQLALAVAMSSALALSACADGGNSGGSQGGGGGEAGATSGTGGDASQLAANNPQDRNSLEQGGSANFEVASFPTNFNGWHVDGNLSDWSQITAATDPSLYTFSPEGEVMARTEYLQEMPKVENTGGKEVITYKMNPKAVWNDGTKMDWKSFEATWKVNKEPVDKGGYNNVVTAGYENIESVKQGASPEEVVVTMKTPFYPPTEIFGGLVHPKLAETPEAFNTLEKDDPHPELRSGPFVIDKLDKTAQTVVLKPNDKWWGNKPLLNQIVFRQMEDSASIPAFKNGEIDATRVGNKARFDQVQGATDMEIRKAPRLTTGVYVFNSKAPSLKDINVRKALWQGINREELKKVRFNGLDYTEKPVTSAFFFNFQPAGEDNMPVTYDPEAAKKTLTDAGYTQGADGIMAKDGQKLSVKYTTFGDDPMSTALAQTVQNQLKAIGVDLQLDVRASSAFGTAMEKKDFDFLSMAWGSNATSPVTSVCQFVCSDSTSNYAAVGTPEIDKAAKAIGSIENVDEQNKEINRIEKEWLALYGQLPLWNGPDMWAYRKGLANYGPAAFASITPKWEDVGWMQGSTHN